jgi:hypothetical protein
MANGLFNLKQVMQAVQQGGWSAQKTPAVEYLVVAGGGGGGSLLAAGGGAGGLLVGIDPVPNGQTLLVTVGGGGGVAAASKGTSGSNSVFGSITSTGGGGGDTSQVGSGGISGGSGGGSVGSTSGVTNPGQGIVNQGNTGGIGAGAGAAQSGGGGGGAGTVGLNGGSTPTGGNGGAGIASAINGTVTTYAGGGGGAIYDNGAGSEGVGGVGGGGKGGGPGGVAVAGTANTGGGGGGGKYPSSVSGAAGGSGIVIVSYPDVYAAATATTGSPTVSTSGSGSIYFTGSSSVYLSTTSNSSSFAFGTGDFTIETWVYINATGTQIIYDSRPSGGAGFTPTLYVNSSTAITYYADGTDRIAGGTLSVSTWYHVALVRIGTVTKMYLNGTQTGSSYTDTNNYVNTSGRPVIGANSNSLGGSPLNGYVSNLRVVKGVGVYTGTFTPSTIPLTATQPAGTNIAAITGTSTSMLLNSVSGGYLADSSTVANTFTVSTTPAWNQLSPFTGTGYKNRVYTWTSSGSITF